MSAPVLELHHPDDETLAAFVDGRADDATRDTVMAHMAECAQCRDVVVMATEIAVEEGAFEEAAGNVVPHRAAGRWLAPLFAAAAAVGAVVYIPAVRHLVVGYEPELVVAAAAPLAKRSSPGRTSMPLPWQDHLVERGAGENGDSDLGAKARLYEVLADNDAALRPNARTSGLAQLSLAKDYDGFNAAVADLTKALSGAQGAERDAIEMDLAAALLGRAKFPRGDDKSDAQRAFDLADAQWKRTKSPVAAWNRAMALYYMHSPEQDAAWRDYLSVDPNSEWAQEATRYLDTDP